MAEELKTTESKIAPTVKTKRSLVSILDERPDVRAAAEKSSGSVYAKGSDANEFANRWWNDYGTKEYAGVELVSPDDVQTNEQANTFINQNQEAEVSDLPPERSVVSSVTDITSKVTKSLEDSGIKKPEAYSAEDSYNELVSDKDLGATEEALNKLNDREELLQDGIRQMNESEDASDAARFVIERRKNKNSQEIQKELDSITRQKNSLTRQLNTKYKAISMIMGFKQTDYQNASTEYNNSFSQAMSMLTLANNLENTEYNREKDEETAARANLQVIYNGIKESGKSIDTLDPTQKTMITGLEVQAGLPIGFYKNFEKVTNGGTVLTTSSWTDAGNNKMVSVVTRDDKTGEIKTTSMVVGKEKATSSGTSSVPSSYKEWQLAGGNNSGYTYAEWAKGDGGKAENEEIQKLRSDAAEMIQKLDAGEIEWGAAWDSLHIKYPKASNEKIDELLGGRYDASTGQGVGRAAL